jgi:hypothetical protein
MAIARGPGSEIIRCYAADDLDSAGRIIIKGEQHHIYTVLSITVFAHTINTAGNYVRCDLYGYDCIGGDANQFPISIFEQEMQSKQTFVWNDKFSFNGHGPTDFAGPLSTVAHQNALADQADSNAQQLYLTTEHADDNFHITCTFIDQNNA